MMAHDEKDAADVSVDVIHDSVDHHAVHHDDAPDGDEEPGYIGNIKENATAGFKYFDFKGVKSITITVRGYANGEFEVRTEREGAVLAKIPVQYSNVWEDYTSDISIPDGVGAIYLTYKGGGNASLLQFTLA